MLPTVRILVSMSKVVGFFVPDAWEVAARFGYLEPEDGAEAFEDAQEYSVVLGRYLNGHGMKIQTGVTFDVENIDGGSRHNGYDL